jgi:transcriptional regulator with XRE-family HTH domain
VQQARLDLAGRLRGIWTEAGLSARQLAARCGWHESKISKLQTAKVLPSEADLRDWAAHCGVPEQGDDLVAVWRALMGAIIRFKGIPDDTEAAVMARMDKQLVLRGRRTFAFLLEETAVRAQVADTDVMAGQLGALLHAASQPQISLGIIPSNAAERPMWPVEGFWIFDEERVLVELVAAEVTVTQPHEIELYERTFTELAKVAAYGAAARTVTAPALEALR